MLIHTYQRALIDQERREGFEKLTDSFLDEQAALFKLKIPYLLDRFHLNAVIDNRKQLQELLLKVKKMREEIRFFTNNGKK